MRQKLALALTLTTLVAAYAAPPAHAGGLIAPPSACIGQTWLYASRSAQETTMRCMVRYARRNAGLPPLADVQSLDRSALRKAGDILHCDSFSHSACGRDFAYWIRLSGYPRSRCWRMGENLAWGTGEHGTVREIFRAWILSPPHRRNILGLYGQIGSALRVGTLAGNRATHVWVQHFGPRCG